MDCHPTLQQYLDLLDKMREVAIAKSHDYAGTEDPMSNFKQCELMGLPAWKGIVVRLGDKFSRICNFAKQNELKVKDESLEDTLLDNAVYSLLCIVLYREWRKDDKTS